MKGSSALQRHRISQNDLQGRSRALLKDRDDLRLTALSSIAMDLNGAMLNVLAGVNPSKDR